jgi:pimeloyl-ACP methyl ester carboxylesterase
MTDRWSSSVDLRAQIPHCAPMRERIEGHIGAGIVRLAEQAQRRAVRARLRQHRADSGRITPYLECGSASGPTLVWLHGFADKPDSFMRTALALADSYRIVAPALPGFGDGWFDPRERHTFEAYAAWMGEVLRAIGGPRYHLMGNSLGAAVAAELAASDSTGSVASLSLVDCAGIDLPGVRSVTDEQRDGDNLFVVRDAHGYQQFLSRIFARPPSLPRPVRVFLADQLRRSADWYERLMADLHASTSAGNIDGVQSNVDLARIRVPTLVVWGERDSLFPVLHGEHIARSIPGAQLEVLAGVGHCPHLESPEQLAAAFRRFAGGLRAHAS